MIMEQTVVFATDHQVPLSRYSQMTAAEAELDTMRIGDIELDPARRTVRKSGHRVHLTPKEFELVQQLMSRAGRPIKHSRLLAAVWGSGYGLRPEYLRTYMCQLRKKLEDDPEHPQYLLTHSHFGYYFADRETAV
jgi:two-component system, OmpR family, KDP operon response regulator KdpE